MPREEVNGNIFTDADFDDMLKQASKEVSDAVNETAAMAQEAVTEEQPKAEAAEAKETENTAQDAAAE